RERGTPEDPAPSRSRLGLERGAPEEPAPSRSRLGLEGSRLGLEWERRLRAILELDAAGGLSPDNLLKLRDLLTPDEGAEFAARLKDLKCCDPAVGSGAFPVGLLHELLTLRRIAETAANGYVDPVRKHGNAWLHDTKEDIVQNCLFGVDLQQQAIEICRLRLWLSLVVDYDLGLDPFTAERKQFTDAIGKISQLPNLEMNFHRGDSLLDLISDVPVRLERSARGIKQKDVDDLRKLGERLHKAKTGERKRELRVEILRRRLDLTERVLVEDLKNLENVDAPAAQNLFGEGLPSREKLRLINQEMIRVRDALKKVQNDKKELEALAKRTFDSAFYPKLRRLEGADFSSPFNFAWQLDFPALFSRDNPGFDIIVGNPPFVTARNPKKRKLYAERWPRVCYKNYLLVCPFFEMSFLNLRFSGQLGYIVSNAFAKRDLGKALIEDFFPGVHLQKIVDCSGLMFPGHGTPTCIIFGRSPNTGENEVWKSSPVRITGIMHGGGDLRTAPEESPLWSVIAREHDVPGYHDRFITVEDMSRVEMSTWPWSFISDRRIETGEASTSLIKYCAESIGAQFITGKDEAFVLSSHHARKAGIPSKYLKLYGNGEDVRDWSFQAGELIVFPYEQDSLQPLGEPLPRSFNNHLQPFKKILENSSVSGSTKKKETKLKWFEFRRLARAKFKLEENIIIPQIATHAHFLLCDHSIAFKEKAQAIALSDGLCDGADFLMLGMLNSSFILDRLKKECFSKRESDSAETDTYYEFSGGKLQDVEISERLTRFLDDQSDSLARGIISLARETSLLGSELAGFGFKNVFKKNGEAYSIWENSLPKSTAVRTHSSSPFATSEMLRANLDRFTNQCEQLRAEMIARQEEMDWLVYAAYGLIDENDPGVGLVADAPSPIRDRERSPSRDREGAGTSGAPRSLTVAARTGPPRDGGTVAARTLTDADLTLARAERPFCLWAAADGDFAKAVDLVPNAWSAAKQTLWRRRLELIRDNEHVRRIEQPVYKRRWDEQYKIGNRWQCGEPAYDAEFIDAFDWWLSEKAEWWLENRSQESGVRRQKSAVALTDWSQALWNDSRVQAAWPVVAGAICRLEAWKVQDKNPDVVFAMPEPRVSFADFARHFKDLVKEQAVPDDIPWAVPWDELEKKCKVPAIVKKIRGKLNVPRERFWLTPDGAYRTVQLDL
ncbi:MAG: hypothetical protein L0Y72_31035, partial [Gemmataceae bacterium]|nr:hypothetical protein [Gemmataceae bacterium]